ncbi:hypothetical protein EHS25_006946 [Saitozyma podzolica]|uniref:Uncharacterized protein n=1 Tax=Saitozyma podzolica TaxID=1890683 RepID=A0A427XRF3_9TREE|nr:hypothetical protein EHS25_006946 [Saitozyma podzolica]
MGLFKNRRSVDNGVVGTGPTTATTTTTTGTHHPVRDGLLTGAVAHHEANNHPTRDGLLAGGAVGEIQHHRNEREMAHANAPMTGTATANPYANGNATVGDGYGGVHHNGVGTGTNGMTSGFGTGATTGAATGAGLGAGTGVTGAHTGPAPLAGVDAGMAGRNSTSTGGTSNSVPTIRQANKLERKGKMEATMGDLFCSSSLRRKSHNHLAQADHLRMQASELTEAERLEQEAGMRRQRAVGLGADPVHASGQTGFAPANRTTAVA